MRFSMIGALLIGLSMATSACEDQPIPTIGLDLGEMFPERSDWYWKYNHDEFSEVSYWHNRGLTTPAGAEWITYRFWVADEQGIIEDIADGDPSSWDLEIFWEEQSNGWYLRGWSANPEGPSAHLGTQIFEEGVPFALSNVPASGATWTASAGGVDWVTTAFREMTELQFNGQVINDAWRIEVATDDGESVLDSVWWLVNGPGFVQWALPDFRDEDSVRAWQHVHNDSYDNILGSR